MDTSPSDALYKALLGDCKDLDEALHQASQEIADIAQRKRVVRKTIRKDGYSCTKIYDVPPPKP